MKDWDLCLCLIVYSVSIFGLGLFLQMKVDQMQLRKFEEKAWTEGCNRCAQFEKDACGRDQLQGVEKEHKIK